MSKQSRQSKRWIQDLKRLQSEAAPGFVPWREPEQTCSSGKRRFDTEHGAQVALKSAKGMRERRSRRGYVGKVEERVYECDLCSGYHLTSMSEETYRSRPQAS